MENELALLKEYLEGITQHQESIEGELRGIDEDHFYIGSLKYDSFKIQDLSRAAINLIESMEMRL